MRGIDALIGLAAGAVGAVLIGLGVGVVIYAARVPW
jgi:hypothetical protein